MRCPRGSPQTACGRSALPGRGVHVPRGAGSARHTTGCRLVACLAIGARLSGSVPAQPPEPNVVPNPSFEVVEPPPPTPERAASGEAAPPEAWLARTWNVTTEGDAEWRCPDDPKQAHTGQRCGYVRADRGGGSIRFGPMPVPREAAWTVRLWARGQGQLAVGGYLTFAETWERMAQEAVLSLTQEWQSFTCTLEPDWACGWWVLDIATRGQTEAWIDDVVVSHADLPALDLPPGRPLGTDEHTLLYLPLDQPLDLGTFFVQGEVGLSEEGAGRFGRSLVLGPGAYVAGPACDYLHVPEGTVELWVKPYWPGSDGAAHSFVAVPGPDGMWLGKDQYAHISFGFSTGWGTVARAWADGYAYTWQPGVWRHVAACWDRALVQVFVDGKLVACAQRFTLPAMLGPELKLGEAMMELDDLRISNVVRYRLPVPQPAAPGLPGGTLPRSG